MLCGQGTPSSCHQYVTKVYGHPKEGEKYGNLCWRVVLQISRTLYCLSDREKSDDEARGEGRLEQFLMKDETAYREKLTIMTRTLNCPVSDS